MKYSLPGHSCIQEVNHAHSEIEKLMRKTDFYNSPIGLIRILKQVNRTNPYRVIQMKQTYFKDFSATSQLLNYKLIPFTQVGVLKFTQVLHIVDYKTSHDWYEPLNRVNLKYNETPKRTKSHSSLSSSSVLNVTPKLQTFRMEMSEAKKKDIKAAFPYMPLQDRDYYKAVLNL
ncbi:hypothetical protein J6590_041185 [Homalodisca vitripennis]|nr:hypothetical protein J6590_041185 [Homalodisca vitripennis]